MNEEKNKPSLLAKTLGDLFIMIVYACLSTLAIVITVAVSRWLLF